MKVKINCGKKFTVCNLQFLFSFVLMLGSLNVFSQAASPYSRYGLGSIRSTVFSANRAMGGLSAAYASSVNINSANPASYGSLTRTTIEIGMNVDLVNIRTSDSTYKANNASISHFAIAFVPSPKKNNWAISLGLLPFSNINYTFIQNFNDSSNIGSYRAIYTGKGSIYNVYGGAGYKVKGFSVGLNLGYLFGRMDYQKTLTFPDSIGAYSTRNVTNMNVGSFSYNLGVQYQRRIFHNSLDPDQRNDIFVTVGAYGSGGLKLNTKISNYWERFNVSNSGIAAVDTPSSQFETSAKIKMPFNIAGGVMFGNERFWMIGTDFKYANWSTFNSPLNNTGLSDSWRLSFGFQIVPKYDDNRRLLNRVQYRFGGYYGKSEATYQGNALSEAGGTVGLGIPFKSLARLNFTADMGVRGGSGEQTIRETFYKLTFGIVLNDIWFIKRKFD